MKWVRFRVAAQDVPRSQALSPKCCIDCFPGCSQITFIWKGINCNHGTSTECWEQTFLYAKLHFKEADGFDESLFVYFEEVDFSVRAREAGWPPILRQLSVPTPVVDEVPMTS